MGIKSSTGLRNYMLGTAAAKGSFRDAFHGASEIRIYGGTVPADADAAAGGAPLVVIQKCSQKASLKASGMLPVRESA